MERGTCCGALACLCLMLAGCSGSEPSDPEATADVGNAHAADGDAGQDDAASPGLDAQTDAGPDEPDSGLVEDAGVEEPCPPGTMVAGADAGCVSVGPARCPWGFDPDPSGWGCATRLSSEPCPPGTRRVLGQRDCGPVGWSSCPEGFAASASGWGCRPVVAADCGGASRAHLGSEVCVPVGDCAAAFPPAEATLFVDDSYLDAQLDGTHFRSIQAAIDHAPVGAFVAIEAGHYSESLLLTKAVMLVGRCPEQVVVEGAKTAPGVRVSGSTVGSRVRGVTLAGHKVGAWVDSGATLILSDSILEANDQAGLFVTGTGSRAVVQRVVIRDTVMNANGEWGGAAFATSGARVELTDAALLRSNTAGLIANGEGASVTATRLVVLHARPRADGRNGEGVLVRDHAKLTWAAGLIEDATGSGLFVDVEGEVTGTDLAVRATKADAEGCGAAVRSHNLSTVTLDGLQIEESVRLAVAAYRASARLSRAVVRGTLSGEPEATCGRGARWNGDSRLELTSVAVVENEVPGIVGAPGLTMTDVRNSLVAGSDDGSFSPGIEATGLDELEDCTLSGNRGANARVTGHLRMTRTLIEANLPGDAREGGVVIEEGGRLTASESTLRDARGPGVRVDGTQASAESPSILEARDSVVLGSRAATAVGHGVVARGFAKLILTDVQVSSNKGTGLVWGENAILQAERVVVRDQRAEEEGRGGFGLLGGGAVELERSAGVANQGVGVFLSGTSAKGRLDLMRVDATAAPGHGVVIANEAAVTLQGAQLGHGDGVGVLVSNAGAVVCSVRLERNGVGLQAQQGTELESVSVAPAEVGARRLAACSDNVIVGNRIEQGDREVVLPTLDGAW